jgi:hypothetical protein
MQLFLNSDQVAEAVKAWLEGQGNIVESVFLAPSGATVNVPDLEFNDDGLYFKHNGTVCRLTERQYALWKHIFTKRSISHAEIEQLTNEKMSAGAAKQLILRMRYALPEQFKNNIHAKNGEFVLSQ